MDQRLRVAQPADGPLLVEMMAEFYSESSYPFDPDQAATAFGRLLADQNLGQVWIIESGTGPAGYVVMTVGYSLEYGGRDAFVDDLFLRPAFRGKGLGTLALAQVRAACLEREVRALHLEVGQDNPGAYSLYRTVGFEDHRRRLLTLKLPRPRTSSAEDRTEE